MAKKVIEGYAFDEENHKDIVKWKNSASVDNKILTFAYLLKNKDNNFTKKVKITVEIEEDGK